MKEELQSFVPSMVALSAMAIIALIVSIVRGGLQADTGAVRKVVKAALLAIILQAVHFAEEAIAGLNRRLPETFGLSPVSMRSFVAVNVVALTIWAFSVGALLQRASWALFPLWFLGVASVSNAALHPALSIATGGYFPGLITSPLAGLAGLLLLRHLGDVTGPKAGR